MMPARQTSPRARKERLVVQELPDETLVYDLDRDRAHCLNQTAAFVWRSCDGRATTKEIAIALGVDAGRPVDEKLVWLAIEQLARHHLLEDIPQFPEQLSGMKRREVIRALGLSAAVALPLVASIVAPTPAQAATCLGAGQPCTSGLECCSSVCNGSNVCL